MPVVRYGVVDSPLGPLLLARTDKGLCRLAFDGDAAVEELEARFDKAIEDPSAVAAVAESLDAYFSRSAPTFDLEVDLSLASPFVQRVLTALLSVPFGEVTTYGALARRAKTSARAVGGAVGSNPIPIVVPCHRVIAADGSLGGFSAGLERKRVLLALEGREGLGGGWEPRRVRRAAR
ncbi:MAG: methylated-DNA--[protein]-cysteine S-methyltransferase [Actinomycetota bacterium]